MANYIEFFKKHLSYFFCLIIISLPILIYNVNDYEEYSQGFYSVKYLYSSLINFFSNYDNKIGFGAVMPIGQGLFFYPTSIFSFNYEIFIITSFVFNISIQYYFFLRISKLLKVSEKYRYNFFINSILVISLVNLVYNYTDDWISLHTSYSIFFAELFYVIKYGLKKLNSSLNKLLIFFLIGFLNGHLAYIFLSTIFLFSIILLNFNYFKINIKVLIIPFIISLFICAPNIFNLTNIYLTYPDLEMAKPNFENVSNSLLYPINFLLRIFDHFFNFNIKNDNLFFHSKILGYGPQLILGFLFSVILFLKKKSKYIFNLDKIYILSFIILVFINSIPIGGYGIYLRDFMNAIFLFIFIIILNEKIFSKFINICLALLLISNLMMFVESCRFIKANDVMINSNNINKEYSTDLKDYLVSISNSKRFFRIYLSEDIYKDINNKQNVFFKNNGIFTPKDFTKYELAVLNVHLKNNPHNNIRKPNLKFHEELFPLNYEIEKKFLMNFFQIKYLFIYEQEIKEIDLSNFKRIKSFNFDNKSLVVFENLSFGHQYILNDLKDLRTCKKYSLINCLVQEKNRIKIDNKITINKISDSKIEVVNSNNNHVNVILPFIDYSLDRDNKNYFYEKFLIKNIKKNDKIIVSYSSQYFIIIKLITIISILFLIYLAYLKKKTF